MKMKPYIIIRATIQVTIVLAVMWACFTGIGFDAGRAFVVTCAVGVLWIAVKGYEQQNQIDELKRELESLKQDRESGTK